MNINLGRMKKWDWGVLIAFVVTIVGVSIPWWKAKIGDLLGGLGDALGELGGLAGAAVPEIPSVNALGWDIDAGVAAFVFALFAALWVLVKILLPADRSLPRWYMEAWPVLIFGAVVTLCGLIGTADAPYGGFDAWAWRPGGLITLVAGVGMVACGYFMLKDKTGDYGESPAPKINVTTGGTPPAGTRRPSSGNERPTQGRKKRHRRAGRSRDRPASSAAGARGPEATMLE